MLSSTNTINLDDRNLVRRVLHHDCDRNVRNGWIGRQLPSMLCQAGLVQCSIETQVVVFEPRLAASYSGAIASSATGDGVITEAEQRAWQGAIEERLAADELFCTISYFLFLGKRPDTGAKPIAPLQEKL